MSTVVAVQSLNPILKWAGGKRWQVPHLKPLWERHAHRRLVEPFCGGMAVTLGLMPERALLNDVNPHLINVYAQVKDHVSPFPSFLTFENNAECYYASRSWFNELIDEKDEKYGRYSDTAAGLFYYLNRTGFNGLCRFNSKGQFNVPFGKYKAINYTREFIDHSMAFASWHFQCGDFSKVALQPDDFVYADPPYDVPFTQYSAGGFNWSDQVNTASWLSKHPGPVVLVNQATERIEELYRALGFSLTYLDAPRRISCTGDRTPAREILATRNL